MGAFPVQVFGVDAAVGGDISDQLLSSLNYKVSALVFFDAERLCRKLTGVDSGHGYCESCEW